MSSMHTPAILIEMLLRSFAFIELPNCGLKCIGLLMKPFLSTNLLREFEATMVVVAFVVGYGECALALDAYNSASKILIFFCSSPIALYFPRLARSLLTIRPISCDLLLGGSTLLGL
jgi:hypothetical protein